MSSCGAHCPCYVRNRGKTSSSQIACSCFIAGPRRVLGATRTWEKAQVKTGHGDVPWYSAGETSRRPESMRSSSADNHGHKAASWQQYQNDRVSDRFFYVDVAVQPHLYCCDEFGSGFGMRFRSPGRGPRQRGHRRAQLSPGRRPRGPARGHRARGQGKRRRRCCRRCSLAAM